MELPNNEDRWIVDSILQGDFDYCIDSLIATMKARRGLIAPAPEKNPMPEPMFQTPERNQLNHLQRGDQVRFKDGISPKYLVGLTALVEYHNRKSVVVSIPDLPQYRRFAGKRQVRCPLSVVEAA